MVEIHTDCEEECFFFIAIPAQQTDLNRWARQVTQRGEELPGSLNTLCGICMKGKIIDSSLEEKGKELLNLK